jgi:hypothetical protein
VPIAAASMKERQNWRQSAPACVIDCHEQVQADPHYLLSVADIEAFERKRSSMHRLLPFLV